MIPSEENPILVPNTKNSWEAEATFNCCPVFGPDKKMKLLYRAVSSPLRIKENNMRISSIGIATSKDGVHFTDRKQFIKPDKDWDVFGCEDPRVMEFEGKYYIFYTALSTYPFGPDGIKTGVAITKDFKKIQEKHIVTTFNSKAMAIFPSRVNGKITALLSVDTDRPPTTKICLAFFDEEKQIWSPEYWNDWYPKSDSQTVPLARSEKDHVEVGAPPIKTKDGWLLIYSYIKNYFSPPPMFSVEAVLLDLKNPFKIVGRTEKPLFVPMEVYEKYGPVPNVVFPSGALVKNGFLNLYYGAADSTCCLAIHRLSSLIKEMFLAKNHEIQLERLDSNPIFIPNPNHMWENKAIINAGAVYDKGKTYLMYRAISEDNTSVIGYASSKDGFNFDERLDTPAYLPRESFEQKSAPNVNSGCEDPRLTKIGNTLYMCYTAYDGKSHPGVALTSIKWKDFVHKKWNWKKPVLISPPEMDDKDAAIFPRKIKGKYAILHRLGEEIWLDFVKSLDFDGTQRIDGEIIMKSRQGGRDSRKIGIAGPPIETKYGWLLLYHGISRKSDNHYHLRAVLLDLKDPSKVIARSRDTILEPIMSYEKSGLVPNVVFSCGAVVNGDKLFVYYGGADKVLGVATVNLKKFLKGLMADSGVDL